MAFDNLMLGYIFAVIGLGMDFIMKAFKSVGSRFLLYMENLLPAAADHQRR